MAVLAIDIGGTKFSLALFEENDGSWAMMSRESRKTDRDGGPEWMLQQIVSIAGAWKFDACGIGFGGPVDFNQQRIALSTHVEGWSNFSLAGVLTDAFKVPVVIDNDANVGALGEALHGAGIHSRPLFYITLSTGIGGGIVLEDNSVYRGADSWAGEIGHITIRPDGPLCLCGARGCLERVCSGLWLERDHGVSPIELFARPDFVATYVIDLAQGLKAAIMLLNPARIVIGGGLAQAGDRLFIPLRTELGRQMTNWSQARVDVVPAVLGNDSVLWGALELARRARLCSTD